jgi:hypothetical protein
LKKSLKIESEVFERLASMPRAEREACWLALSELVSSFGRPHVHSGLSIRKLTPKVFECRGTLGWRFIFDVSDDELRVRALATHDEIRRMIRSGAL